ncbi:MAG TPA: phosphonate ABC transporter, permease protein PhnE [Symbiobacteriaceae bacterium]|nr:phosphonate ABC transporter, permease protein PhnE [Symbiobacteriaceae bacterium]
MSKTMRRYQAALYAGLALVLVLWATTTARFDGFSWSQVLPNILGILRGIFLGTDWAYAAEGTVKLLQTMEMAVLGTLIAAVLALPFAFLASRNVAARFAGVGRFLLNVIRTVPEIILAIIFIKGVGPGAMAGVLAMGIHSIGLMGKLYADAVEAIDKGPIEAIQACGGNRLQQIWYGMIPQVLPEFASFVLYRFEINARAAVVLGVVGAAGIGTPLLFAILSGEWGRVGIILLLIVVAVSLIDLGSGKLRKKLV